MTADEALTEVNDAKQQPLPPLNIGWFTVADTLADELRRLRNKLARVEALAPRWRDLAKDAGPVTSSNLRLQARELLQTLLDDDSEVNP
jgi:hypothetical protein